MFSVNLENSPRFQATDVTSIINMMGKMKLQCMRIVIVTEQNIEKVRCPGFDNVVYWNIFRSKINIKGRNRL